MPGIINSVEYTTPFINAAQYNAYLGGTKVFRVPTPDLVIEDERDTVLEINSGGDGEFIVPFSSFVGRNKTVDVMLNIYIKGQYPTGLQTLQFNDTGSDSKGLVISGLRTDTDYIIDIYPTDEQYTSGWNVCFGFNGTNPTGVASNPNKPTNKQKLKKVLLFTADSVYYSGGGWMEYLFMNCTNLTEFHDSYESSISPGSNVSANDDLLYQTFYNCQSLSVLEFPTVHVTNPYGNGMFYMTFYDCHSLTDPINIVYDNDTSPTNIGNNFMYGMYNGCTSLTRCDPEPSYTKVSIIGTNFLATKFLGCSSLTTPAEEMAFDQTWNTMTIGEGFRFGQYYYCTGLTKTAAEVCPKTSSALTLGSYFRQLQYDGCSSLEYLGGKLVDLPFYSGMSYIGYRQEQFGGCSKLNMLQEDGTVTALGLLSYNLLTFISTTAPINSNPTYALFNLFDTVTGFTGDDGGVELQLYNGSSYVNISSITRGSGRQTGRYMWRGRPASSSIDTYYTTGS